MKLPGKGNAKRSLQQRIPEITRFLLMHDPARWRVILDTVTLPETNIATGKSYKESHLPTINFQVRSHVSFREVNGSFAIHVLNPAFWMFF